MDDSTTAVFGLIKPEVNVSTTWPTRDDDMRPLLHADQDRREGGDNPSGEESR